jgi:hypothetical protein
LHLTIGIAVFLASLKWVNWGEWQRYYPTILYIISTNLIYKFFALSYFHLWKLSSMDLFFNNHTGIFLWHLLFVNTLLIFIYLSNFPKVELKKKIMYILFWVALFIVIEILLLRFNHINYFNGWHLGWTIFFDMIMLLMLRLHYKKPLLAIILSIPNTLFYLIVFEYF